MKGVETVVVWDILFPVGEGQNLRAAVETIGVRCAASASEAVRGADMIICDVTAASSLDAAKSVKPQLSSAPYFPDINSVSPGRKQDTAKLLSDTAR
jgi:3-hydroxyisobutyrate dehydrogenase-like beta-hydroxyacid dehydrogenase